jgi:plasmid stabilization system protein ParE
MKILWSESALSDIEEIVAYISKDSVQYAINFASKIVETVDTLARFPNIGRIVPEYNKSKIREMVFRNYRIVYRIKSDIIEIVTIFQGCRLLE